MAGERRRTRASARPSSAACSAKSAGRRIENLSKGFRQRTALAGALVHQPPVLILDEPTIGLDPVQIIKIRETIRELGKDRAVLLSTHILPEVEAVCDRVLIIDRGRIVAEGTPTELRGKLAGAPSIRVVVRGAVAARDAFASLPGVTAAEVTDAAGETRVRLVCAQGADPREDVFRAGRRAGLGAARARARGAVARGRLRPADAPRGAGGRARGRTRRGRAVRAGPEGSAS